MRLSELLSAADIHPAAVSGDDPDVVDVRIDSRQVRPGSLFACLPGASVDGHDFAADAVAAGAVALLVERPLALDVAQVRVDDARRHVGPLAAVAAGRPADHLQMIGVTGTNGKTTVTWLIAAVLRSVGRSSELIGTLTGTHTTPEAPDLQRRLSDMVATDVGSVVMEVSSHALELHRVDGCLFDLAVFTNLGRDHLDLHGTMERYFAAKARLFTPDLSRRALVNRDDVHGRLLLDAALVPTVAYGLDDVTDLEVDAGAHRYRWRGVDVRVGLGGRFNASNSLAAASACALLGLEPSEIAAGLADAPPVPGRMEPIDAGQPFAVLVDYAHTPDGLQEVLATLRTVARQRSGRLIVVMGCGGDRDRDKRPEMGRVSAALADEVVITSDNPRSEDPASIIAAVRAGVPAGYGGRLVTEVDRRAAIAVALTDARPGDVVLIAGKGHETTQDIGGVILPFDDRAVARTLLEAHR